MVFLNSILYFNGGPLHGFIARDLTMLIAGAPAAVGDNDGGVPRDHPPARHPASVRGVSRPGPEGRRWQDQHDAQRCARIRGDAGGEFSQS
jgi:hypothetical protein